MKKRKMILIPRVNVITHLAKQHNISVFVETGTHLGFMIGAVKSHFDILYTVELNENFYKKAIQKFSGDSKIHMLFGDSAEVLPLLVPNIAHPCIYWLDAHFSGGDTAYGNIRTPICSEVETIAKHANKNDVLLIDNIECFKGQKRQREDYPSIEEVKEVLQEGQPEWTVFVKDQILRAHKCLGKGCLHEI